MHKPKIESRTIPDFVINIIQAPGEENIHAALDFRVLLTNTKFG